MEIRVTDKTILRPEELRPAQPGKADFFSWQLYRWMKRRPHACQIWEGTWNSVTGVDRARPVRYIGYMEEDAPGGGRWFHGELLKRVCCFGAPLDSLAFGPAHDTRNWREVTDDWWLCYRAIGVCAIHGNAAHEWVTHGDERTCRYCGKREQRRVKWVPRAYWEDMEGGAINEQDPHARLLAVCRDLAQELDDHYRQHRCGCGHPACKRCSDDQMIARALEKAHEALAEQEYQDEQASLYAL